jgi:hypothetical protein
MADDEDYDDNTNDGNDTDIINGCGGGSINGGDCCDLAIIAVLRTADSL